MYFTCAKIRFLRQLTKNLKARISKELLADYQKVEDLSTKRAVDNLWISGENYFPLKQLISFPLSLIFSIFVPLLKKI